MNIGDSVRRAAKQTALLAALVVSIGAMTTGTASAAGPSYVSIGDSYAAMGVPIEAGACRSENDSAHQIATALRLSLTDVSCGGATTSDESEAQASPANPPQDEALTPGTEVVTVTMGGNDHGLFGTLVFGCTQLDVYEHAAGKAPCKEHFSSYVTSTYAQDKPEAEAALNHIKELSPKAKVFLVGYLEITPNKGICPTQVPWYEGDLKWFHKVEAEGAKLESEEAKATGAVFVNMFKNGKGHNACQTAEERWVEPLVGALTGVPLHPSVAGVEQMAFDTELAMLKTGVR